MTNIGKLGTIVRVPDGREGTVVFNGLMGVGVKWGRHNPNPNDFAGTDGNTTCDDAPEDFKWEPDALLRDPAVQRPGVLDGWACVCDEKLVEVIRYGLNDWVSEEEAP